MNKKMPKDIRLFVEKIASQNFKTRKIIVTIMVQK